MLKEERPSPASIATDRRSSLTLTHLCSNTIPAKTSYMSVLNALISRRLTGALLQCYYTHTLVVARNKLRESICRKPM